VGNFPSGFNQPQQISPNTTMRRTQTPCCSSLPWRLALGLTVLAVAAGGCGKKGKKNEVTGKVVLLKKDGTTQDVTGGNITFHPDPDGTPYPGTIKPDGTFEFSGVPSGRMRVTVETESLKSQSGGGYTMPKTPRLPAEAKDFQMQKPDLDTSGRPTYVKIPALYAKPNTTKLTCEITEGKNELGTLELKE